MNMTDPITTFFQTVTGQPFASHIELIAGILIVISIPTAFFKWYYDRSQRKKVTAKQEYAKHCDSLFNLFILDWNTKHTRSGDSSLNAFFEHFDYKGQFLPHLFTGYDEFFIIITSVINNDRQRTQLDSQEQWKESSRINDKFKQSFDKFKKDILLKNETFGGVCEDCKVNYEKAYKTKEMTEKLESFTMPF